MTVFLIWLLSKENECDNECKYILAFIYKFVNQLREINKKNVHFDFKQLHGNIVPGTVHTSTCTRNQNADWFLIDSFKFCSTQKKCCITIYDTTKMLKWNRINVVFNIDKTHVPILIPVRKPTKLMILFRYEMNIEDKKSSEYKNI